MKVLIVGSGGREHTLAWKITQSPLVSRVFCAPGNAGTSFSCENVPIESEDIEKLAEFAKDNKIDLTIVGPEQPLVLGIVDCFQEKGMRIFGPSKKAAELEGSKSFAKEIMKKYGIPTAAFHSFADPKKAMDELENRKYPLVIKADGLAAGKGVIICQEKKEALEAIKQIMEEKAYGSAGNSIVIEGFLKGEEVSYLAFVDGENILPLASSQDHKAIFDGDKGPNTGGMGAYSPAPIMDQKLMDRVTEEIAKPVVNGMKLEGRPYKGILYAGLMIDEGNPKVLEFNCRLGDPETQPVLFRMKSDIIPVFQAAIDGKLGTQNIEWLDKPAVCVVMASKGYPGSYEKGLPIAGLDDKGDVEGGTVFHAGVAFKEDELVTNGGRVLGVTATGFDIKNAIDNVYRAVSKIHWDGVYYRKDIGSKAIGNS